LSHIGSEADEAFDRFLEETYSKLIGAVYLMTRDRGVAEDIVQETFARAYLNWRKLWPDGNPGGWTYRVAVNLSTSWRRRLVREAKMISRLGPPANPSNPEQLIDPDLWKLVSELPPRQRQAVALHYTLDLPLEEVARAMGCKVGTVKASLHAARESLKKNLETT
jgi:RNA polymerase sigma-70 factor (ECF subfamily)